MKTDRKKQKKLLWKKTISIVLTGVMMMTSCLPVYAASNQLNLIAKVSEMMVWTSLTSSSGHFFSLRRTLA